MADENQQMMQMQMHSQTPPQMQPLQQQQTSQMQPLQQQQASQMQPLQQQQAPQQQQQTQQAPQQQPQQPPQLQQQPQQQQQAVAVTMSLGNNLDQTSSMNQPNALALNATMNVSQPQGMNGGQVTINDSTGTPVHMTVPQLTAAAAPTPAPTAVMSQSSGQHPTMIHSAMSMPQSPLQQVQVIQQPLPASYLHQLYPQQQMLFPGSLTLQHASMTAPALQGLNPAQGLSLQLQTKANLDPKTSVAGQTLQAVNATNKGISFTTSNMMTATGQMLGPGAKANFQQQVMAGPGKQAIIHGQTQFAPGNANQTVVIGQLGVLPNQPSVYNQKALADSQKKTYMVNQPTALQPKSPIFSSSIPPHSSAQVFNGNQLKQLTSSPQLITSQAPGTVLSQAQILGSLQALGASLPQGISWAAPGLQSPALLAQNPIFIRSQHSDMFIQSQPQAAVHLPVAASAPLPPTTYATAAVAPQKPKQVRMRPGSSVATQTVVSTVATVQSSTPPYRTQVQPGSSVATQTVSTIATVQASTPPFRAQNKAKPRTISSHLTPSSPNAQNMLQINSTQTQANQSLRQLMPPPPIPQHQQQFQSPLQQQQQLHLQQQQQLQMQHHQQQQQLQQQLQQQQQQQQLILPQPRNDASNQTKPVPEMKSTSTQSKSVAVEAKQMLSPPMKSQAKVAPSTKIATKMPFPTITSVAPLATVTVTNSSTSMAVASTVPVAPTFAMQTSETEQQEMIQEQHQYDNSEPPLEPIPPPVPPQSIEVKPLSEISHEIRPMSNLAKDRHPQKAIVKPHVLTHVIDGYIIQEGPEPFPVGRSALLTDINVPKPTPTNAPNETTEKTRVVPEKKVKIHLRSRGPVELAKCESCGKLGAKAKFKKSKRFCSTSCAKRFNVCSKRSPSIQENVFVGGRKRKKMGFKKNQRKTEANRMPYNAQEWQQQDGHNDSMPSGESRVSDELMKSKDEDSLMDSLTGTENVMAMNTVHSQKESMEVDPPETPATPSTKSFNKWTVNEVFEFIRDLSGCSDYADEFRSQEIDGQALLLLKEDHLMTAMGMKLGPALKLIARIDSIKEEMAHS